MRKIIRRSALLILAFCLASSSRAQRVIPGVKGGLNVSEIADYSGGQDSRISGHLGFFLHIKVVGKWGLQPELQYSGEGMRYLRDGDRYTLALNYVELPLLFQYEPARNFYLEFGPQLGYLMAARVKGAGVNTSVYSDYNKIDMRLDLGMGVKISPVFGFYGRYGLGLSDINPNSSNSYYNRVFQVGLYARLQ